MTLSYTPRFHLAVPDFLSEPWHAEFAAAMESIDQALYTAIVAQNANTWIHDHAYAIGDIVIDPGTGTLYSAAVAHTSSSAAIAPTFANEVSLHPTYWTSFAVTAASQAEAETGTDNSKYMTPLRTAQAITAQSPTPGIATQVQAQEGTDNTQIMTPLRVVQGVTARIASQAQAVAGTDNNTLMTPLRVAQQVVATGVAGGTAIGFSAHKNGVNQTGIVASVTTKVTFGTELYDLGNLYDTSNSRWTPPSGQIHIDAAVYVLNGAAANSNVELFVYKNGIGFRSSLIMVSATSQGTQISVDDIANGTDYYELFVVCGAGPITLSGATYQSYFMGTFLGQVGVVTVGLAEIGFRATKGGTSQTGIPNSTWTKVTFATEEYDQGNLYDNATSRWVAPTGIVHITACLDMIGSLGVGGVNAVGIYKNGALLKNSITVAASGGNWGSSVSTDDIASGTDYYEVFVLVQTGGPASVDGPPAQTYFTGHRITGAQGPKGDAGPQGPSGSLTAPITNSGRLLYVSATALSFMPFNGDRIKINGVMQQIPTTGILGLNNTSAFVNGASAQPLAANTTYYVYVFLNAGVLTADFSTTGHVTSVALSNEGTEIKIGDNTRTLIGMIRTGGTGAVQFVDSPVNRYVLSWFNRRSIAMAGLGYSGYIPAIASPVEYASNTRIYFLTWGDEACNFSVSGLTFCADIQGPWSGLAIGIDTVSAFSIPSGQYAMSSSVLPGYYMAHGHSGTVSIAEGLHFAASLATGSSNTIYAQALLTGMIRG